MKNSNRKSVIVAVIVILIVAALFLVAKSLLTGNVVSAAGKCTWQTAYFNQIGDDVIIGSSCQTTTSENFNPFLTGGIISSGVTYTDACDGISYMNEYWCDGSVAKKTYGSCTGGCNNNKCASKVRVCAPASVVAITNYQAPSS